MTHLIKLLTSDFEPIEKGTATFIILPTDERISPGDILVFRRYTEVGESMPGGQEQETDQFLIFEAGICEDIEEPLKYDYHTIVSLIPLILQTK